MKKLNRSLTLVPVRLNNVSYITHNWDDHIKSKHKRKMWEELFKMQNTLCVYCELPAEQDGQYKGHIEHFYNKGFKKGQGSIYKSLTFVWDNLFGCCASKDHCGNYKDETPRNNNGYSREYDPNLLIKPDIDDPELYLKFLDSGKVEPKTGLQPRQLMIAKETIKALNLDCSTLKESRLNQIQLYKKRLNALNSYTDLTDTELDYEYSIIQADARQDYHRTAIKHVVI